MADPKEQEREAIFKAVAASIPQANPTIWKDWAEGFNVHLEPDDVIAVWQAARATPVVAQEPVAWCELTQGLKIAYFDGKPMVMPGAVGNDCHTTPLYTHPAPDAAAIRAAALAEAATMCNSLLTGDGSSPEDIGWNSAIESCIDALRALATKGTT